MEDVSLCLEQRSVRSVCFFMPLVVTVVVKTFGLHERVWAAGTRRFSPAEVVTTRFGLTFVFCSVHLDHHVVQLLLLHHADALRTHSEASSSLICLFIARNQSSVGVWAQNRSVSNVTFRKLICFFLFPAWLIAKINFSVKHLLLDEITQNALLQISESFCRTHTHTLFSSITDIILSYSYSFLSFSPDVIIIRTSIEWVPPAIQRPICSRLKSQNGLFFFPASPTDSIWAQTVETVSL